MALAAALVLVVIGALGAFVPLLPGAPLILAGALLLEWFEPAYLSQGALIALGVLTALSLAADLAVPAALGAGRKALFGAALGAFIGFWFGGIGALFGAVAGAAVAERSLYEGGRVAVGLALAVAVRAVLVVAMVLTFVLAILIP